MIRTAITDKEVCREFAEEANRRGFKKPSRAVAALAIERLMQIRIERDSAPAQPRDEQAEKQPAAQPQ